MSRMNLTEEELDERLASIPRREVEAKVLKVLERYTKLELAELLPIVKGIDNYDIIPLYVETITDMKEKNGEYIIHINKAELEALNVIAKHDYDIRVDSVFYKR